MNNMISVKENEDFLVKVKQYIKTYNPTLVICTPCYGSVLYVNYTICLTQTIELFRKIGFPLIVEFCRNDSLVCRARNNLIAKALSNKDMTHILFIDNDITWEPIDVLKLVMDNKHVIGGIYPLKKYDWSKLVPNPETGVSIIQTILEKKNDSLLKEFITDEETIQTNLVGYNINYMSSKLQIDNNIMKVRHMATGFLMIQREALEWMISAYPETKYVDDVGFLSLEESQYAYALFDCGVENGHYYSEDWLFCHRWTSLGQEVFADVSINLHHTGVHDFRGCYLSSILSMQTKFV